MDNAEQNAAPKKPSWLGAALRSKVEWLRSRTFWKSRGARIGLASLLLLIVGLLAWCCLTGSSGDAGKGIAIRLGWRTSPAVEAPLTPPDIRRRKIDGKPLAEGELDSSRYFAAMIDNHVDARPQAGLAKASLVYEAPVEGGITRFMAVYPEGQTVDRIGPVRSARTYFLDWASEYDALYAHVGGSPEALELLRKFGMRDLNQFFFGPSFWRDSKRFAPHNTYTTTDLLAAADTDRFAEREAAAFAGRLFKDDIAAQVRPKKTVLAIDYGDASMNVTWTYDPSTNDYARTQGGRVIKDEDGTPVRAKNVIVQYAKVSTIDNVGRRRVTTIGDGQAVAAFDGSVYPGKWHKEDRESATRFDDANGSELRMNAGTTWIEIVPIGTEVAF